MNQFIQDKTRVPLNKPVTIMNRVELKPVHAVTNDRHVVHWSRSYGAHTEVRVIFPEIPGFTQWGLETKHEY